MTKQYIKLIKKTKLSVNDGNSGMTRTPNVGSTGTAVRRHRDKYLVIWDNENPVCKNFKWESMVGVGQFSFIDDEEFDSCKLTNSYINAYTKNRWGLDLRSPQYFINDHLKNITFKNDSQKHSVFIGCDIDGAKLTTNSLIYNHFISCCFTNLKSFNPIGTVITPPSTMIDVEGLNLDSVKMAE